jgi:adenosine deaminase
VFASPDFCGGSDPVAWREYFAAISEAAEAARARTGIDCRFVGTCVRHFGPEKAEVAALRCAEVAGDLMVGFGMGGAEGYLRPADFSRAFSCAAEAGLPLTTHAGEFGGPESVFESLDHLGVKRIGHGVRSIEDAGLIDRLAAEGITLEVNPGSNIALGVYGNWADHPIERLRAAGVPVTISTDDPPYFHTDMTNEYDMLEQVFGWGGAEFAQVNENAVTAAFCDAATKAKLRAILNGE